MKNRLEEYLKETKKSYNELWDKRANILRQKYYNQNDLNSLSTTISLLKGRIDATEFALSLINE